MNGGSIPSGGASPVGDGFTPPPPNVDFIQGPNETPPPF